MYSSDRINSGNLSAWALRKSGWWSFGCDSPVVSSHIFHTEPFAAAVLSALFITHASLPCFSRALRAGVEVPLLILVLKWTKLQFLAELMVSHFQNAWSF